MAVFILRLKCWRHVISALEGQTCLVSGSGNVAQHTVEKLVDLGAKVVTLSDSSGYIYDPDGLDADKLTYVKRLKNIRRGRIKDYAEKYPSAVYTEADITSLDYNPLWGRRAVCAFPCATQNEINRKGRLQSDQQQCQAGVRRGQHALYARGGRHFPGAQMCSFAPGKGSQRRRGGGFRPGDWCKTVCASTGCRRGGSSGSKLL